MDYVDLCKQVRSKFFQWAPQLWWGDALDVRFYMLSKLMELKNQKVLDIGCNIGVSLSFLDDSNELHGVDIDPFCVNTAKELNSSVDVHLASMNQLPFKSDSFDVIVMMNVLPYYDFFVEDHVKNKFLKDTLSEVARCLKSDGTLYFSTPNGSSLHYINSNKVKYDELMALMNKFNFNLSGWNSIKPFSRKLPKRFRYIPPKILCKFKSVWSYLVSNMGKDVNVSKYYYIEGKKRV